MESSMKQIEKDIETLPNDKNRRSSVMEMELQMASIEKDMNQAKERE
jgi:hypothetical protein